MSDANLGRALLEIGADYRKFDKVMQQAESKANSFVGRVKSLFSRLESAVARPQIVAPVDSAFKALNVTVGAAGKITQKYSFENQAAAQQAAKLRQRTLELKETQLANAQATLKAKEATTNLKTAKALAAQAAIKSAESLNTERREMLDVSSVARSLQGHLKDLAGGAGQAASGAASFGHSLAGMASGAGRQAISTLGNLAGQTRQVGSTLTNFAGQSASAAGHALLDLGNRALSAGRELAGLASSGVQKAGAGLVSLGRSAISAADGLVKLAGSGVNRLVGLFGKLSSGALKAARDLAGFGADAAGKAVSGLSRLGQEAATVTVKIEKLAGSGRSLLGKLIDDLGRVGLAATGIKAIADGAGRLTSAVTAGNAQFEDYNVQFATLIKNSADFKTKYKDVTDPLKLQALAAQEATKKMQELAHFGAVTPFDLTQVVEAQRVLMGFGLAAENAKQRFGQSGQDILRIAGDVASGTGAGFSEIADDIGKFSSGATGESIARFQELGIVTRDQLRKAGLQFSSSGELIAKSQAQLDRATAILLKTMSDKYSGLMEQQSRTFNGMLSNLRDWIGNTTRTLTAPLFEPLKKGLAALLDYLGSDAATAKINRLRDLIQQMVDRAGVALKYVEGHAKGFEDRLTALYKAVVGQVVPALKNLYERLLPVALQVLRLTQAVNPLHIALVTLNGFLTGGLSGGLTALAGQVGRVVSIIRNVIPAIVRVMTELALRVVGLVNEYAPRLFRQFSDWGRALIEWVAPKAKQLLEELGRLAVQLFAWIKQRAPEIGSNLLQWGEAFLKWILPIAGKALTELAKVASAILSWAAEQAPAFLSKALKWGEAFILWVAPIVGRLLVELFKLGKAVLGWIVDNAPAIARQIGQWASAFIGWVKEVGPGIVSKLREGLTTILDWIAKNGPAILSKLLAWREAFIAWIAPILAPIISKLAEVVGRLLDWIAGQTPAILNTLWGWAKAFGDWIIPVVGPLLGKLDNLIAVIVGWIADHAGEILSTVLRWAEALGSFVAPAILRIVAGLARLAGTVIGWLAAHAPEILNGALAIGLGLVGAILPELPAIIRGLVDLVINITGWLAQHTPQILSAALLVAKTIADNIIPAIPAIVNNLVDLFNGIVAWLNGGGLKTILDTALKIGLAIADALIPKLPDIIAGLFTLLGNIAGWLKDNLPIILNEGMKLAAALGDGLVKNAPAFAEKVGELLGVLFQWLKNHGPEIIAGFAKFGQDLIGGVVPAFLKGFGVDASGALNIFGGIINDLILPVLKSLLSTALKVGQGVSEFAKTVIAEFGGWKGINALIQTMIGWFDKLWPVVVKVAESIISILIPIFRSMVNVIDTIIMPAILKFADFFETNMMPVLRKVGDFIANTLVPVFGKIAAFILNDVAPVVLKLAGIFVDTFLPIIQKVFQVFSDVVLPKLHDFFEFIKTNVIPVVQEWAHQIGDILGKAFNLLGPIVGSVIDQVTNYFKIGWTAAQPIIGFFLTSIQKMIEVFNNLKDTAIQVWNRIGSLGQGIGDTFRNAFRGVMNFIIGVVNSIVRVLNGAIDIANSLPGGFINIGHLGELSYLAKGTASAPGGPAIVGEAGPELLKIGNQSFLADRPTFLPNLPTGSMVLNARETRAALGADNNLSKISPARGGGQPQVNQITVNPSQGMDEKQLAKLVVQKIEEKEREKERTLTGRQGFATRK